jgi:hypothetical protein
MLKVSRRVRGNDFSQFVEWAVTNPNKITTVNKVEFSKKFDETTRTYFEDLGYTIHKVELMTDNDKDLQSKLRPYRITMSYEMQDVRFFKNYGEAKAYAKAN